MKTLKERYAEAEALYYNGQHGKVFPLMEALAKEGYVEAQDSLARCYEHGHGVPADSAAADEWWRKAAAQGHEGAREALNLCPKCGVALKKRGMEGDDMVYKCPKCDYEKYVPMFFGPPPKIDFD